MTGTATTIEAMAGDLGAHLCAADVGCDSCEGKRGRMFYARALGLHVCEACLPAGYATRAALEASPEGAALAAWRAGKEGGAP